MKKVKGRYGELLSEAEGLPYQHFGIGNGDGSLGQGWATSQDRKAVLHLLKSSRG